MNKFTFQISTSLADPHQTQLSQQQHGLRGYHFTTAAWQMKIET